MDIDDEIKARVRAAKIWDSDARLEDFQIKVAGQGYVLVNLKTGQAQLIFDNDSDLKDFRELFPNICFVAFSSQISDDNGSSDPVII